MTDQISPIEFGRVLGLLEGIRLEIAELRTRTIFRLDTLEARVETLELSGRESAPYLGLLRQAAAVVVAALVGTTLGGMLR
jgi:hypothetical protein